MRIEGRVVLINLKEEKFGFILGRLVLARQ
jgi:hypothetical protein